MKRSHFLVYTLILAIIFVSGCDKKDEQQKQSTISVFGIGTVLVQPDMIQMTITLSNVAQTTKIAQEAVNSMVRQALAILKEADIEDKNISTASLRFNSEYEYTNRRVLIGQKAEQKISFSIDDINNDDERVSRIIDQLIKINGIELDQIHFSVKNDIEYFIKSRELAYQKDVDKANQYAELSKLKIIKVLNISEEDNQAISSINNILVNQAFVDTETASDGGSTIIPVGELKITTKILIVFLLE